MAKEVGGDFYDVIPAETAAEKKRPACVVMADVSGKGVPAALFMALSRTVIRVNASRYANPADVIRDANNVIWHDSESGMFVTTVYAQVDSENRRFTYVNAGHNPPLLFRGRTHDIIQLGPTGIAVGMMENARYEAKDLAMEPGDIIVLYTDGVTEAINQQDQMFGQERLQHMVRTSKSSSAGDLLEDILEAVRSFCGDQLQSDDITLMVIRCAVR